MIQALWFRLRGGGTWIEQVIAWQFLATLTIVALLFALVLR